MRAVLTGDRQAIKVMAWKEDIKAAQILQQLPASESAPAISAQGQEADTNESAGSRKNHGTLPRRQEQPTERVGASMESASTDKGTNILRKVHKAKQ